jgi:hypothetical protein
MIKGMGALPSPKDVRNYVAVCAANEEDFPEEFELEMPEVKDQGRVGSCVAHALATVVEYFDRTQGDNIGRMSVGYIYGNRSNYYTGRGRHVSVAIRDLQKYGVCPHDRFPENVEVPRAIELVKERMYDLHPEAYPNRISSYYELRGNADIRAALMQGSPVVFSMEWFDDITVDENGVIHTDREPSGSYHALVIYGWNKDGWKIQNSWGAEWGMGGRAILPYDVPRREDWGFTDTYSENARRQREAELENRIEVLAAELHIKNEECSELAKKYANAISKVILQNDKIAQLNNALAVAEEAHDAISERCEELHGQINGLRAELQKQKETAGESIEALQEAVAKKQSALAALESDKSSMADIIRELNKEIKAQKNARIDLENAYSGLESKHSECSITLEEARAKIAEMKDELDIAQADMNNVNAQLTEALEEIDTLENQLLEIKKPFSSGIGKVIAKIINWLINTFGGNDGTNT